MIPIALTLAVLAAGILVVARKLAEKAENARRELNALRTDVSEISEHLGSAKEMAESVRAMVAQVMILREVSELRLTTLEGEFRDHASGLRELLRAQSEYSRSQRAEAVAEMISKSRESVSGIQSTMEEMADQLHALAVLPAKVDEASRLVSKEITAVWDRVSELTKEVGALQQGDGVLAGRVSELTKEVGALQQGDGVVASRVSELTKEVGALQQGDGMLSERVGGLTAEIRDLRTNHTRLAGSVEIMLHMPSRNSPIDREVLRSKPESEMILLAQAVTMVRPLVPYPKWRFDADWANPDLTFQLRQSIWQYFHDRRSETPVIVNWHRGASLGLYLGNDLSRQIYIGGCIDPNEFAFLDRFLQPGMTFFDLGANEGIYSVFAGKCVGAEGAVWAFEPSRRELSRLERNIASNGLSVRILPLALADRSGEGELTVAAYEHEGQNTLGAFVYDIQSMGKQPVELARLDDVLARDPVSRIDLIKIDVEGAELRLIRGASETLRRYRPFLLFEASDDALKNQGDSLEQLLKLVRNYGYSIYCFDRYSGLPVPASEIYSDNLIGIPAEKSLPDRIFRPWPDIASLDPTPGSTQPLSARRPK